MNREMIKLPPSVADAIGRLEACGHEAYAVGGCVRDTLLGRSPHDWDVTTSARPEEVASCFAGERIIETGIRHGTLTVLLDGEPIEITTFRNDGEYEDNRHPVRVTFSDRVEEDLARRDFTVNAMAYNPKCGIVDLFGGEEDLLARRIACVGEPSDRFHEDGLRILRAIRFASVLDFQIEEKTAEAIHTCRHLLSNIAKERIREEFCKLMLGTGAVRILREYIDVIGEFVPELLPSVGFEQNSRYHCYDVFEHTLHALEYAPKDVTVRLAILFHDIAKPLCYTEDETGGHFKGHASLGRDITKEIVTRLRFDNATADVVVKLVEQHDRTLSAEPRLVKRLMQQMSEETVLRLLEVKRCDRLAHAKDYALPPEELSLIPSVMKEIKRSNECFSLKALAVKGGDLISVGIPAGKTMGDILAALLEEVIDGRLPNEREALLDAAREIWKKTKQ